MSSRHWNREETGELVVINKIKPLGATAQTLRCQFNESLKAHLHVSVGQAKHWNASEGPGTLRCVLWHRVSHSTSLRSGAQMCIGEFNAGRNLAMDKRPILRKTEIFLVAYASENPCKPAVWDNWHDVDFTFFHFSSIKVILIPPG